MTTPPIRYARASDGARIAYTVIPGASPPWLHLYTVGAPTIELDFSLTARRGYIENLAQGRATVLYDPRGSGYSSPISGALSLGDLCADVEAVMGAVGEPVDVSVMGTGCFPALRYAACSGLNWRSMVLLAPVLRFAGSPQERFQSIWREGSYSGYLRVAARSTMEIPVLETETFVRRWHQLVPAETATAYIAAIETVDLTEAAASISLPSLIGSPDGAYGGTDVAALIPGAKLAAISSAINRPELGLEVRDLWETHIGRDLPGESAVSNNGDNADGLAILTSRESEVIALIAAGKTDPQIAEHLTISPATASRHVHNILEKLGMGRRSEAAAWWATHGREK